MHDIKQIRRTPDEFQSKLRKRGVEIDPDDILVLDRRRIELAQSIDDKRGWRNSASKQIGEMKRSGQDVSALKQQVIQHGEELKKLELERRKLDEQIKDHLIALPNLPADETPAGLSESQNVEVKTWGEIPDFDFEPKDHLAVAERLEMLDFKRGGKITGSGFPVWSGAGAALERALLNFMLDLQTHKHGYREMMTPFVANRESMLGTGQLPKLEDDMYRIEKDDLFLLPTSEVTLVNLHSGEILSESDLPIKYAAYSPCFRREAGAYGKDTRGFLRTHQFNKIELVRFEKPDESYVALAKLVGHAEEVLQKLELRYRVLKLCAGELPFSGAVTYDLEVWAPADGGRWLEVSSCTNAEDFQARRANIRYRPRDGGKLEYVHTINGSGLATSRLLVAILECCQTEEGSFAVPPALRSYMNEMTVVTSPVEKSK